MTKESFSPIDLDDEFESFMRNVYPNVPEPSAQYWESRRIFFSGMTLIFSHFMKFPLITPEQSITELESMGKQFGEFQKMVRDGKA